MVKIVNAVVRCLERGSTRSEYLIGMGLNHADCYTYLGEAYGCYPKLAPMKYIYEEGYLLDDHSFVNRKDAFKIAKENGQLLPEYSHYTDVLNEGLKSYMVDWSK